MATKFVIGLGNPGEEYVWSRHNSGFIVIDQLAKDLGVDKDDWKLDKYSGAMTAKTKVKSQSVVLVKPMKMMNNSGKVVAQVVGKSKPEHILVIYDDKDLPLGTLRVRKMGSNGGHKGLGGIIRLLKTEQVGRLRFGVGPQRGGIKNIVDYILGSFKPAEQKTVKSLAKKASQAVQTFILEGVDATMNEWNTKFGK